MKTDPPTIQAAADALVKFASPDVRAASLLRRLLQEITRYHRDLKVWSEPLGPAWRILIQARGRVLTDAKADTSVIMGSNGEHWRTLRDIADLMGARHGQTFMLEFVEPDPTPRGAYKAAWPFDERRIVALMTELLREMTGQPVEVESHGAGTSVVLAVSRLPDTPRLRGIMSGLNDIVAQIGYRHQRTVRLAAGQAVEKTLT